MMEKLAAIVLVGLALAGCTETTRANEPVGSGGSAPSASGGAPGSGGAAPVSSADGSAAAGSGGSVSSGGSGPATADASTPASGGSDARASDGAAMSMPPPSGDVWAVCGAVTFKPGISAEDFCAKYETACSFNPAGGADDKQRFKSMADCVTGYNSLDSMPKGGRACVAWAVCTAAHSMTPDQYCIRGPQAVMMNGPCKTQYL
jgi:hypothetical protein